MSKNIEELFSNEFENYLVEPSEDEFLQMDKIILENEKKKKTKKFIFYFGGIAVAAFLLSFAFYPKNEENKVIKTTITPSVKLEDQVRNDKAQVSDETIIKENNVSNKLYINNTKPLKTDKISEKQPETVSNKENKTTDKSISETKEQIEKPAISHEKIELETRPIYKTHYHIKHETKIFEKDSVK